MSDSQATDHTEMLSFNITTIPNFDVILGMTWLAKHNPAVDWLARSIMFHCNCTSRRLPASELEHSAAAVTFKEFPDSMNDIGQDGSVGLQQPDPGPASSKLPLALRSTYAFPLAGSWSKKQTLAT